MMNFAQFLTPEEAWEKYNDLPSVSLGEFQIRARDNRKCLNCGNQVWRIVATELCFTCTTGALDASDDFEVGLPY